LTEDERADPLLEEAIDWLLRLKNASQDLEAARAFDVWRARSPAHARAWEKARRTWHVLGKVRPEHEDLWRPRAGPVPASRRTPAASRAPRRWGGRGRAAGVAAMAAAGVLLFLAAPSLLLRFQADYMTATGESRVVTLADGSTVTLGAHSAIATALTGERRHVTLLSGEAFFEVTPDASRPFVVAAGGVDVTVLGTGFDVALSPDTTAVELAHGSVRVVPGQAGGQAGATLVPGEMVVVDRGTGAMEKVAIAPDDIAAWRNGQIFVNDATIGSVVERLRRYHHAWISLPDAALAAQRVTGLYDLRDPDRALRALVRPYGGQVHEISPYLRVVSRL